ncbi:MAG: hypothetical protein A3C27_01045 [Candidatus Levybacteria bacterium RIFCSPHIGHO2_02_FULL_39_36]|nr:MAG: hypothetical protein UT20_C0005G0007 [Candidatus Levybacteria bacterium GW2011_GWA1_39_11]KKR25095.1 MAG: hypothetical protein UT56_C0003G0019 [Candidatus Levybacteria bacterium GW2011_GWB1_39_7]KKR26245.1 MAG: hypothetical protein UT57_C0038G0006 [Microgenomates group bacterium GW2011_GWC1_39_7]OGH15533.1 MAG: hypothetical protein A2689_03065 [Candidatus Levybacteria bacterium RIFCSPHIGHO2_01_FULL_38_96]OGH25443.1 MAG: hypothetical protein A3E68_01040 [Candidatus Levybacteria bacterium
MDNHNILQSFGFAFAGLVHAFRENRNIKIHFSIAILVMAAAILLHITLPEIILLLVMIVMVISAEMINTSIEEMINLITTERREEAKIAKDVAAGMVLIFSIGSAIVGIMVFAPYILKLI